MKTIKTALQLSDLPQPDLFKTHAPLFDSNPRSPQEIAYEIERIRMSVPIGQYRTQNYILAKLAIEELTTGYDMDSPEYNELTAMEKDIIWIARNWKAGKNDLAPSESCCEL